MGEWPWEASVAIAGLAIPNLILACRWIFRSLRGSDGVSLRIHERGWERTTELETEVRLLRIALQRQSTRSSAYATVSQILLLAMPMPLEDRIRAVKQAREIAERALPPSLRGESSK